MFTGQVQFSSRASNYVEFPSRGYQVTLSCNNDVCTTQCNTLFWNMLGVVLLIMEVVQLNLCNYSVTCCCCPCSLILFNTKDSNTGKVSCFKYNRGAVNLSRTPPTDGFSDQRPQIRLYSYAASLHSRLHFYLLQQLLPVI